MRPLASTIRRIPALIGPESGCGLADIVFQLDHSQIPTAIQSNCSHQRPQFGHFSTESRLETGYGPAGNVFRPDCGQFLTTIRPDSDRTIVGFRPYRGQGGRSNGRERRWQLGAGWQSCMGHVRSVLRIYIFVRVGYNPMHARRRQSLCRRNSYRRFWKYRINTIGLPVNQEGISVARSRSKSGRNWAKSWPPVWRPRIAQIPIESQHESGRDLAEHGVQPDRGQTLTPAGPWPGSDRIAARIRPTPVVPRTHVKYDN